MKAGQRYGAFEIIEHIGSGSFGHVYSVRAPRFTEEVALKVSLAPVTEVDVAQRALREVAVMRSLTNPHAVDIYDCGLHRDGHIYVLMELLDGRPLSTWHDFDRAIAPGWACHVIHQCCLGLTEAHDRGIVHRDLKPANVFVQQGVFVRVLDFGLARSWSDDSIIGNEATGSHMIVGTAHYAQPEQLKTRTLTPAADVYSLGMIMYELVTARTPFVADMPVSEVVEEWKRVPVAWMRGHSKTAVVPPSRYLPPGHEALDALILRMLDKDPKRRPQSARELASAIEDAWPDPPPS